MAEDQTPPESPPTLPEVKRMLLGVQTRAEMAIEDADPGATEVRVSLEDLHTTVWVLETTVNMLNAIFMIAIKQYGVTSMFEDDSNDDTVIDVEGEVVEDDEPRPQLMAPRLALPK